MAKKTKQATSKQDGPAEPTNQAEPTSQKTRRAARPKAPVTSPAPTTDQPSAGPPQIATVSRYQSFQAATIHRRELRGAVYNPRTISPAQRRKLKRSLERFGLSEPLIFNRRSGNLVGGHQRLSVLDELEGTDDYSLTCSVVDLDDAAERALNIALNNPELQGQYDMALLETVVSGLLDTSPASVQDAGLDRSSLAMLFGDSFLLPAAAQQATADAPIVNQLNEMYGAGQANEKARRAAQAQLASAGRPVATTPDHASPTGPASDTIPPDGAQAPAPDMPAGFDFAARRREFNADRQTLDQADVYLTLVFDTADQLAAFRHHLGLDPMSRTIDAVQFSGLFELEMGELEAAFAAHEAGEQASDEPEPDAIPPG